MRILFTLNYLILAFNFETFVVNLFSKYKEAKRDCRAARSWSTRHCNKQDSAKTVVSSSTSLPLKILLYETDSKLHKKLAAHRLLSLDKIHINFETYSTELDLSIGNMYRYEHRCPRFDWTVLQVVRTSFLGPRPRFCAPPHPPPPTRVTYLQKLWRRTSVWLLLVVLEITWSTVLFPGLLSPPLSTERIP